MNITEKKTVLIELSDKEAADMRDVLKSGLKGITMWTDSHEVIWALMEKLGEYDEDN